MTELLDNLTTHLKTMFNDVKRFEPFDITRAKNGIIVTSFPFEDLTVTIGVMTCDGKTKVNRNQAIWQRVISVGSTYYTF